MSSCRCDQGFSECLLKVGISGGLLWAFYNGVVQGQRLIYNGDDFFIQHRINKSKPSAMDVNETFLISICTFLF